MTARDTRFLMNFSRRIVGVPALAMALIACGCVIVPTPAAFIPPHDTFKDKVGAAGTSVPLRIGVSTTQQVKGALGEPWIEPWDDLKIWRYSQDYVTGYFITIPGPCNSLVNPIYGHYRLAIRFRSDGTIGSFSIE